MELIHNIPDEKKIQELKDQIVEDDLKSDDNKTQIR